MPVSVPPTIEIYGSLVLLCVIVAVALDSMLDLWLEGRRQWSAQSRSDEQAESLLGSQCNEHGGEHEGQAEGLLPEERVDAPSWGSESESDARLDGCGRG